MKDLNSDELQQLVLFYKNKCSELEMTYLLEQLNFKKIIIEKGKEKEEEFKKKFNEQALEFQRWLEDDKKTYKEEINSLKKEITKKEKELLKLKNNK
jgi:vacuolar-type H+-ATPase subunit I/STV1